NIGQAGARCEGTGSNIRNAIRDDDAGETVAVDECAVTDANEAWWKFQIRQVRTVPKSIGADAGEAIRSGDVRQIDAASKRPLLDYGERWRQRAAGQFFTVSKGPTGNFVDST